MAADSSHPAPILIALPKGAVLSGITTWAYRLASGLSGRGRRVMLLVHETERTPGAGALSRLGELPLVEVRVIRGMPAIDDPLLEPRPEIAEYVRAVGYLHGATGRPVVAIPTYSAECFGLLAEVSRRLPGRVAPIGWMHNDVPYDRRTFEHYEAVLHRFVGVSSGIVESLRGSPALRAADVRLLPYGIMVPDSPPKRDSAGIGCAARPVRIVYAGRMEIEQKRVTALLEMSRALASRGVAHELTLVGDGPAAARIDALMAGNSAVRRVSASSGAGADAVTPHLDRADVFMLASRYEGLSVAMLEAMARGCVPVVTRVSGAIDAVAPPGEAACGVVVDAPAGVEDPGVGPALAEGVIQALSLGLGALSRVAHRRAGERFSEAVMCDAAGSLADEVAAEPARVWPAERPTSAVDFTVPSDAADRASRALSGLAGRTVALWGAGRHTDRVASALARSPANIVAVLDDHVGDTPRRLGPWPIASADQLQAMGVTDVVISTALHEPMLWARRAELERLGLRVHRLYAA